MLKDTGKKIVALDLRGFGKSSYNNKCHRFGDWAQDVV
jgi:alpha-beta hydrolase superfamily lysophospholipase